MALLQIAVLATGLVLAAAQECDVCHLHYYHKEVSSPEVFGVDVTQCREYQSEACCSPKTVKGIKVAGYLYGTGDGLSGSCPNRSDKCQAFYVEELCFYECDKNLGKYRKHEDCTNDKPGDNGWEIEAMPVKASYCNAWYDACKDDMVCTGPNRRHSETKACMARNAENKNTAACQKYSDVYTGGKDMCETMWGKSFVYESEETKAYTMTFPEGTVNPNNFIFTDKKFPSVCTNHTVNITHPHVDAITGERITGEQAGCAANWHLMADSGHPLSGTATKPEKATVDRTALHYMVFATVKLTGYTVATFKDAEQLAFKKGVATFAMVNSIDVNIISMAAVGDGVGVVFTVRVSDATAATAATTAIGKTAPATMTSVLNVGGLTAVTSVTRTTTPYNNAPAKSTSGSTSGFSTVAVLFAVLPFAAVMLLA